MGIAYLRDKYMLLLFLDLGGGQVSADLRRCWDCIEAAFVAQHTSSCLSPLPASAARCPAPSWALFIPLRWHRSLLTAWVWLTSLMEVAQPKYGLLFSPVLGSLLTISLFGSYTENIANGNRSQQRALLCCGRDCTVLSHVHKGSRGMQYFVQERNCSDITPVILYCFFSFLSNSHLPESTGGWLIVPHEEIEED